MKTNILLLLQHGNTRHTERRRDDDNDAGNDAMAGERDELAADNSQTEQDEREHQPPFDDLPQTDPAEDLDDNSRNNNNNNSSERDNKTVRKIKNIEWEIKDGEQALLSAGYIKNLCDHLLLRLQSSVLILKRAFPLPIAAISRIDARSQGRGHRLDLHMANPEQA